MSAYTTNDLIKSVRVRGMFPDASHGTLSPANILLVASEQLRIEIVPMILSVREKYYETFIDYDMVANQSIYDIPRRAVGGICSIVQYIVNTSVNSLAPLDPKDILTTTTGLYPRGFYFENDKVVIYPTPNGSQGQVRIRYYQETSLLEQTLNCAQITEVDDPNGTVTVATYPSSWASGMAVDFVSNSAPYSPYGIDTAIQVISAGNVISFDALPKNRDGNLMVKKGDWLALAGYTPIPEIMNVFFPILAQTTAVKLLGAIGDQPNRKTAAEELGGMIKEAIKLVTPRDVYGLKKVKSDWRNW